MSETGARPGAAANRDDPWPCDSHGSYRQTVTTQIQMAKRAVQLYQMALRHC